MFGNSNTFDPTKDIPDLSGRVFVVTGGSAGIGFGIVAHLLEHGPEKIYLLSNKVQHAREAIEELKNYGDSSKVVWKQCDLEDFGQVKQVAEELKDDLTSLDALVLNAGLGVGPYGETVDGLDSHMQVNQFSQHLLAMILLPVLKKTPKSRIVSQSSDLHKGAPSDVSFESKAEINTDIGAMRLYGRTKLAQILWVRALDQRLRKGVPAGDTSGGKIFGTMIFLQEISSSTS
jgi:WW domain-containing oxidoreductase